MFPPLSLVFGIRPAAFAPFGRIPLFLGICQPWDSAVLGIRPAKFAPVGRIPLFLGFVSLGIFRCSWNSPGEVRSDWRDFAVLGILPGESRSDWIDFLNLRIFEVHTGEILEIL